MCAEAYTVTVVFASNERGMLPLSVAEQASGSNRVRHLHPERRHSCSAAGEPARAMGKACCGPAWCPGTRRGDACGTTAERNRM